MKKESALAVLAACCIAMPGAAFAASEADCAAQWKSADGNSDGVLVGPEADGRIDQKSFMQACQSDVFMAKAPEAGAPLKGANSFTEAQAKDRALAAGLTSVASLVKDGDGIWRGSAMKDGKAVKVAVDFKGNVVSE